MPPTWFMSAVDAVEMGTGVALDRGEAWLRYEGHRAGKGKPVSEGDARYWLTTVMVREAAQERERRRSGDGVQGHVIRAVKRAPATSSPEEEASYAPPSAEEAAAIDRALQELVAPPRRAPTSGRSLDEPLGADEIATFEARRRDAIAKLRAVDLTAEHPYGTPRNT